MQRKCATCGDPYTAKRAHSKFCGDTCRKRARRSPASKTEPVADTSRDIGGLVSATTRELEEAGRLGSMLGQVALELARRIATRAETGSAVASMTKQLRETMAGALVGAVVVDDPLDELRGRRDAKRTAG